MSAADSYTAKRKWVAFAFGMVGAAIACLLVWFAAYLHDETVPTWGYVLAMLFGHADFSDALMYVHREGWNGR